MLLNTQRPKQWLLRLFWRALDRRRRRRYLQRQQAALALRPWRLRALQQPALLRSVCRLRKAQLQLASTLRRCLHEIWQFSVIKAQGLCQRCQLHPEILALRSGLTLQG